MRGNRCEKKDEVLPRMTLRIFQFLVLTSSLLYFIAGSEH